MPSSRKRQTRLGLTPLPSSSPAARSYPQQIRDRVAAVTLEGLLSSAEKTESIATTHHRDEESAVLPTPVATLDGAQDSKSDDDEPVQPLKRRASSHIFGDPKRPRTGRHILDLTDKGLRRDPHVVRSHVNDDGPLSAAGHVSLISDGSDKEFPSSARLLRDTSRKQDARRIRDAVKGKATTNKARITRSSSQKQHTNSVDPNVESEPRSVTGIMDLDGDTGESDGDMPTTNGKQSRRARSRRSSFVVSSSPPRAVDTDDDVEIVSPLRKRTRRHVEKVESEDEDEPITPRRRKLALPTRRLSQQEKQDLDEDLDFLGPSSDVENPKPMRSTQSTQKTAKQKALELLRKKRAGEQLVKEEEDQAEEDEQEGETADSSHESDVEETALAPASSRNIFTREEEDDGFITEEGDDDLLGVPNGIPIEFTRYASLKAKQLFKYVVDWMVQKKINPAFRMEDEIYELAFQKLDNEVKVLAGSKFTSSAWTADFTRSLRARPGISYSKLNRSDSEYLQNKCDACNRSKHPATWQIQFEEKPYDKNTLEAVGGDDDETTSEELSGSRHDGEDTNDEPDWDASGLEIPPQSRTYYVGKVCMSNARTAHALVHWRYHLNEWVIDWLDGRGYNDPEKVVQRDRWTTKKRRKFANKISDAMEKDGVIKDLYASYKLEIDAARDSKQGRWTVDSL